MLAIAAAAFYWISRSIQGGDGVVAPPHPALSPSGGEGFVLLSLTEGEGRVRVNP